MSLSTTSVRAELVEALFFVFGAALKGKAALRQAQGERVLGTAKGAGK